MYVQKSEITLMNNMRSWAGTIAMLMAIIGPHRLHEAVVQDTSFCEISLGIFSGVAQAALHQVKNTMVHSGE